MGYTWLLGIALGTMGSFVSNLGLNVQKLNHMRNELNYELLSNNDSNQDNVHDKLDKDNNNSNGSTNSTNKNDINSDYSSINSDHSNINGVHTNINHDNINFQPVSKVKKNYCGQPLWLCGLFLIILGSFFDFAALSFAPQSAVAPLGSLTLVANNIFAPILLGESVDRISIISTIIIVIGSIVTVAFASHRTEKMDIDELISLFEEPRMLIYSICIVGSILVIHSFVRFMNQMHHAAYESGRCEANLTDEEIAYLKIRGVHRFLSAALSGIVGAQSVLFAKCVAVMIRLTVEGHGSLFIHFETYLILVGMFLSIFLQIRWLNSALIRFSVLSVVPVFQAFWILVSVIGGMIFFAEYEEVFGPHKLLNSLLFPTGVLLTVSGVYLITLRNDSSDMKIVVDTNNDIESSTSKLKKMLITPDSSVDNNNFDLFTTKSNNSHRLSIDYGFFGRLSVTIAPTEPNATIVEGYETRRKSEDLGTRKISKRLFRKKRRHSDFSSRNNSSRLLVLPIDHDSESDDGEM